MQNIVIGRLSEGNNPRRFFDPAEMQELQESIKAQGVLQPILVRPLGNGYQIIAGHRRFKAALEVFGAEGEIPALVKDMTDDEADQAALLENVIRADMSPSEEAEAAAKILAASNGDRDEAAKRLGWTRQTMDKRLGLMNASDAVRNALTERKILLGHAELLAAVPKAMQEKTLEGMLSKDKMPSVAELKAKLQQIACPLKDVIFDMKDCAGCQHNSAQQGALFGEAIAEGNCLNQSCYNGKVEASLNQKAEGLKDEYPTVKIVQSGENFTLLKLVADGTLGVGTEQAAACRGCAKFGAAISNVPGKVGQIYTDLCFDPSCNSKKVAERIAAEKPKDEPKAKATTSSAPAAKAGEAKSATKAAPAEKPVATSVQESTRLKEYRVKMWRAMLRKEVMDDPGKNLITLLACCLTGNARHIDSIKMKNGMEKMIGRPVVSTDLTLTCEDVETLNQDNLQMLHKGMVATIMGAIEERQLIQLMHFMKVDVAKHWYVNADYLDLLTKSEIEVVADEIGLKAHMDKAFAKAMSGKKEEIIKELLKAEGFAFAGKIPRSMQYKETK